MFQNIRSSVDYNTCSYPNSNFILSDSCSNSLLASEESEYQFYRRIRSLAETNCSKQKNPKASRMSNPDSNTHNREPKEETTPSNPKSSTENGPIKPSEKEQNKYRKSQYNSSPLKYDQLKDLSPRRKLKTRPSTLSDSAVLTVPDLSKKGEDQDETSQKESDALPVPPRRGQSSPSRKGTCNRSPNRSVYQGEKISHSRDVKTPEFVKRHYDRFCIHEMREGTRQQFVLIANAYNTDDTRKQIVHKYKRLIAESTPMKKVAAKQNEDELVKYMKWLDSENRDVGFGSQIDLRNQSYIALRTARREQDETGPSVTTPRTAKQNKRTEEK